MSKRTLKAIILVCISIILLRCNTTMGVNINTRTRYNELVGKSTVRTLEGEFEYSINDDNETVTITNYIGSKEELNIPDTILGKKVTGIKFEFPLNLVKRITIPQWISEVEGLWLANLESIYVNEKNENYLSVEGVLYNKNKTKIVSYPGGRINESYQIENTVTDIGNNAFWGAIYLKNITIPDTVTNIGAYAFEQCDITNIMIPEKVASIKPNAFLECSNLVSINVDEKNQNYVSVDGVLYSKDKIEIVKYPAGKQNTSYEIEPEVINIKEYAFCGCRNLKSITTPLATKNIGIYAFRYCINLDSIIIREGLANISPGAFDTCPNLTMLCENNLYAKQYAEENGIKYEMITTNNVQSIQLNKTSTTIKKGETETLVATIKPSNVENKLIRWGSDNDDIATVDSNGKVTANNIGKATITVSTTDGNKKATCDVTVVESANSGKYEINEQNKTIRIQAKTTVNLLTQEIQGNVLKDNKQLEENDLLSTGSILRRPNGTEYNIIVIGDINKNGKVTTTDLLKLKKNIVHLEKFDELQNMAGDINANGTITTTDLLQIKRLIVGLL